MSFQMRVSWLKAVSAFVTIFGLLLALGAWPPGAIVAQLVADIAFWPPDGAQTTGAPETRLMLATAGSILAGWGVMLWMVSARLFPRDPALARAMILTSVVLWFIVDGVASVAAGASFNAVLNIGFLVLFLIPLTGAAKPDAE